MKTNPQKITKENCHTKHEEMAKGFKMPICPVCGKELIPNPPIIMTIRTKGQIIYRAPEVCRDN